MRTGVYGYAELLSPSAYPTPQPRKVELRETHVSWVFLTETQVFKVKKPVNLGFLDYTSVEKRRQACLAEISLNSRLSSWVYLGIAPITRDEQGRHQIRGNGPIVDWAVHMIRLPDELRGDALLTSGKWLNHHTVSLAKCISRFHSSTRCDAETSAFGKAEAIRYNVTENFLQTRDTLTGHLEKPKALFIEEWQLGFLKRHASLFQQRMEQKHIRDGHGDLRLEQIYFLPGPGGITIIDCIEFNDRFRYADTASDLAFLSMDLRFNGREDLAEHLLGCYARESNDFDLYGLIDFYESYRAFVRGKVSSFLEADPGAPPGTRARAGDLARRFYQLAYLKSAMPSREKRLIAVGGIIASGKSTLAETLSENAAIPVVNSDRTRKWLLGVAPTEPLHDGLWQGAYTTSITERVYGECFRRASIILDSGRSVIVDATFGSRRIRDQIRQLAQRHSADFVFLECQAPRTVCKDRLKERERMTGVSDGRLEIFDDFSARFDPVTELPLSQHIIVDTTQPIQELIRSLVPFGRLKSLRLSG